MIGVKRCKAKAGSRIVKWFPLGAHEVVMSCDIIVRKVTLEAELFESA